MKILTGVLTVKEIKGLNIKENDSLSFDFEYIDSVDNYFIVLNGERFLSFSNYRDRLNSFNKIKRMGLGLGWIKPILTDEEEGIIQASKNGENPFAYSIICSNPELNEVVK